MSGCRFMSISGYKLITQIAVMTLLFAPLCASGDTLISGFECSSPGSVNPRCDWRAFGAGTTDRGITASGSAGQAAYHYVDWDQSSWGVGNIMDYSLDLSEYDAIQLDARMVSDTGHVGIAKIRLAMDTSNGEWTTASVNLGPAYQTYTFYLSSMSGNGTLDLTDCTLKLIVEKNGQQGEARFDFDQIIAIGDEPITQLTPVTLNPPPDGDQVRAMWCYAGSAFGSLPQTQDILDFCAREGVNRIYLGAYGVWTGSNADQKQMMRDFIEVAHASGIRVEALIGDAGWYDNPGMVEYRISQILTIHTADPENQNDDFDAIHFDSEFWLDGGWQSGNEPNNQEIAKGFLENVLETARAYLNSNGEADMEVNVDMSAHTDQSSMLPSDFLYNGKTQHFIEHLLDLADNVVLMSYYDSINALATVTTPELDMAAAMGRTIQLGADLAPVPPEVASNTFADDDPTPYAAMTMVLNDFHARLNASRLAALQGFSIFYYQYYSAAAPNPGNIADFDGDADVDSEDCKEFFSYLSSPGQSVSGLARDADLDRDGDVDLADYSLLTQCYTGSGSTGPVAEVCER